MKFNGICKFKTKDGKWLVRIDDGDMELDPVDEQFYRLSTITPSFEELPECTWIPPGHRGVE